MKRRGAGKRLTPSVMFIAGEPSGDSHAAAVIRKLKKLCGHADVWGIGGPRMVEAGFRQIMPFEPFNRMGFVEVVSHLPFFLSAKKKVIRKMKSPRTRPDVLVCVDYSGFNMPVMKEARKLGIPVVWYIAPMVWAWKRKRAKVLGKSASHIAVIFPFETQYFSKYAAPVTFVGNPLTESLPKIKPNKGSPPSFGAGFNLAIVPGSRPQEIKKMLPLMIDAALMLREKYPQINIAVSKFGNSNRKLFDDALSKHGINIFTGQLSALLQKSDFALITSGTATLEAALLGVPMVIAYKTSSVSYAIYKRLITILHIGLPNIIAGKTIVPECIQDGATPHDMFEKADGLISAPKLYRQTVKSLSELRRSLGEKKPSEEVADIVYYYLR